MPTQKRQTLLFLILCAFLLVRPLISTYYFCSDGPLGGLCLREIFGVGISYAFLIGILLSGVQPRLGVAGISILVFLLYSALSVLWGSNVRELSRLIMPAFLFFAVQSAVNEKKNIDVLFILLLAGFMLPVLVSSGLILSGQSVSFTIYWTGLTRYQGVYGGTHTFAHEMFVFITIAALYLAHGGNSDKNRKHYFIYLAIILSIFNIYKSYTRTVYLGLAALSGLLLYGRRRYGLLAAALLVLLVVVISSSAFQTIFFDVMDPLQGKGNIEDIGSGRLGLWTNAMTIFSEMPVERYFLGTGLGAGEALHSRPSFGASHNDLISLLTSLGIIGLLLYLWMICSFFVEIVRSDLDRPLKYTYLGFLFAVLAMNFGSNSYLSRFELAQYFFFTMGTFYVLRDVKSEERQKQERVPTVCVHSQFPNRKN